MGERVTFPSSTGSNLAGIIEVADRAVRGWRAFSHGTARGSALRLPRRTRRGDRLRAPHRRGAPSRNHAGCEDRLAGNTRVPRIAAHMTDRPQLTARTFALKLGGLLPWRAGGGPRVAPQVDTAINLGSGMADTLGFPANPQGLSRRPRPMLRGQARAYVALRRLRHTRCGRDAASS